MMFFKYLGFKVHLNSEAFVYRHLVKYSGSGKKSLYLFQRKAQNWNTWSTGKTRRKLEENSEKTLKTADK